MLTGYRSLLFGSLLLLLGLGSWWLLQEEEMRFHVRPQPNSPDYYLEGFSAIVMDDRGRPARRLVAQHLSHYPDDDSTELTAPDITLYTDETPPWEIQSETGWISGDKQRIQLRGQVEIDRSGGDGVRPLHIVTRDLNIEPEKYYAETDQDVSAKSGDDWLESTGMQLWYAEPIRIKLEGRVRGRYDPN